MSRRARLAPSGSPDAMLTRIGVALGMSLMRVVFWVLRLLPERRSVGVARGVSRGLALPSAGARRRAQEVVFAASTRQALEQEHIDYLARMRVHGARLPLETPESLREQVRLEGEEHLVAARAGKRGVMIVSGHVGSWLHLLPALAGRGYPMLFLVSPSLPGLGGYIESLATRHRFALASVGDAAHNVSGDHLRGGGVLYVTIDATVHPERSVWLRLGQAEVLVDPGPAVLALRHRVPVIFASTYHDDTGRSCIRLSPPIETGPGTPFERPGSLLQHWLDRLWADIETRPGQWWPIAYVAVRRPQPNASSGAPVPAAAAR